MFDFLFNWAPQFETKIEILDMHHQQFFRIGRDCEQLIQMKCIGVSDKQLLDIVSTLKEYITYHFYEEEGMMLDYAYPDMERHKESHRKLIQQIAAINISRLKAEPLEELKKLRSMLQDIVFFHILDDDKKMATYIIGLQNKMRAEVESLELKKDEFEEKYGLKICDLDLSTAYLIRNQHDRGRSILIFRDKAKDIAKLTALERNIFFSDLARLAKAIKNVFSPDAFHYAEYCDVEERLHMHVVPKYKQSDWYGEIFPPDKPDCILSDEEYREIAEKIRREIKN